MTRLALAIACALLWSQAFAWTYRKDADPMGRGEVKRAYTQSANEIALGFPYGGPQRAILTIRSHPKWGRDVYIDLEKAQILCRRDDCAIGVRFDDAPPQTFPGAEPADHSSNTIFIRGYDRFVAQMAKAKRVRIELSFYQQGNRVLEFNVSGFDWPDLLPQKFRSTRSKTKPDAESRPALQEKMKRCNEDAAGKKGDDRRAFMSECLRR